MNSKYHMTSQSQAKCPGRVEVLVDASGLSMAGQERSGLNESSSAAASEHIHCGMPGSKLHTPRSGNHQT